jgi:TonB family protein
MQNLKGYWPLITAAIVGLLLVVCAEPISKWVAANRAEHNGQVIGTIIQVEGSVRRVHSGNVELLASPVTTPVELRDGDRIQTSLESRGAVLLNSQDEIEIPPGSAVDFQLWNPRDPNSPIYVNSSLGGLIPRKAGVKGKAYVVKDGRLYFPGQKPVEKPVALTVLRNAPLDLHLADSKNSEAGQGDFTNDNSAAGGDDTAAPALTAGLDPDTLSNEYIDETILEHQGQLQKCWLTRLKDSPSLKGQVIVQFEISRRGKVKEIRVADATLQDDILQKCVMSVIERIPFRPYKGSEISLSYPINFE